MRRDLGLVLLGLALAAIFGTIAATVSKPAGIGGEIVVLGAGAWLYFRDSRIGTRPSRASRRRAGEILATASVSFKGRDWGPVPLWTVDLVDPLNMSCDVHAYTEEEARRDRGLLDLVAERIEATTTPVP